MEVKASRQRSSRRNHHGIRNALVRYEEHAENRQLRTRLLTQISRKGRKEAVDDTENIENDRSNSPITDIRRLREAYEDIREIFAAENERLEEGDEELVVKNLPKKPSFPYLIFPIAVLKDLFDVLATLIVIGIPVSMTLSFLMSLILFFWVLGKMSGGWYKKMFIRWMLTWLVIACLGENTPFLNMLPVTSIFILMVHFRETKIVRLISTAMEELHRRGIKV